MALDTMMDSEIEDAGVINLANTLVAMSAMTSPVYDSRIGSCSATGDVNAYAKLEGPNWIYYIQKLSVNLGRSDVPTKPGSLHPIESQIKTSGAALNLTASALDVHLSDSEEVNRRHLRIDFNFGKQQWELSCFGRCGVLVDGIAYEPFCQPIPLEASSEIQIGSVVRFQFILPIDLERADSGDDFSTEQKLESPRSLKSASATSSPVDERKLKITLLLNKSAGIIEQRSVSVRPAAKHRRSLSEAVGSENDSDSGESSDLTRSSGDSSSKPPISYACLIAEAINSTLDCKLTLNGIYTHLMDKYPYFRHTKSGWQNSVRHNLSLNKAFMKIPRNPNEPGKGMFWSIDQNFAHLVTNNSSSPAAISSNSSMSSSKRHKGRNRSQISATPPPISTSRYSSMTSREQFEMPGGIAQPMPTSSNFYLPGGSNSSPTSANLISFPAPLQGPAPIYFTYPFAPMSNAYPQFNPTASFTPQQSSPIPDEKQAAAGEEETD